MVSFRSRLCAAVWVGLSLLSGMPMAQAQPLAELPLGTAPSDAGLRDMHQRVRAQWEQVRAARRPVDATRIQGLLDAVQTGLQTPGDSARLRQLAQQLLDAQILMMPSRPVEMRGALIDADLLGADPAGMAKWLDRLQAAGFNAVFPEVFRRGYALFPNRVAEVDTLYARKQVDALKEITTLARARGLQVYPWLWTFRVFSTSLSTDNPVASRLPALLSPQLIPVTPSEGLEDESASFVSPAAPEWRQLMATLLSDIARTYPVDGFLLDYIRYGNGATADQLSATRFQMDYFNRVGNFPPKVIDPASDLQGEWQLWREEQVHRMVQTLQLALADVRPGLALGGAVFRNEVNARNTKMQNWRHWSDNNWVQFVAPMLYASSPDQLDLWLDWESDQGRRQDMLYPILGLQSMRTPGELFNQIDLLQRRHIPGMLLFAVRQLNDATLERLKNGPFRTPAVPPHANLASALRRQLEASAAWLDSLNEPAAATLAADWRAQASAGRPESLQAGLNGLDQRLRSAPLSEELRRELNEQLAEVQALVRIAVAHDPNGRRLVPPSRPPSAVLPEARPLPEVNVPRVGQAPQIDGDLEEAAWQSAGRIPALWWNTGAARPQAETQIRLGHDGQALYLGFVNHEPRMDRLKAAYRVDGNEQLVFQGDDTLEIFLSPGDNPKAYHYFALNAINTRFHKTAGGVGGSGAWESAVVRLNQSWQAELRLPLSGLGGSPTGSWRGNFCRRRPQEITPYHCWSMTFGGVHRPDRFGSLRLQNGISGAQTNGVDPL
ncbi:MAG: family 10 glycosylhydrolase [Candidatus Sericytochromatia bacterium]